MYLIIMNEQKIKIYFITIPVCQAVRYYTACLNFYRAMVCITRLLSQDVCLCVCLSVCYTPIFYRNGYTYVQTPFQVSHTNFLAIF